MTDKTSLMETHNSNVYKNFRDPNSKFYKDLVYLHFMSTEYFPVYRESMKHDRWITDFNEFVKEDYKTEKELNRQEAKMYGTFYRTKKNIYAFFLITSIVIFVHLILMVFILLFIQT